MVRTAGLTFASRLFGAILSFGLIILVSRWLGSEIRGICGLYLVIIAITTAISDIAGGATAPYLLQIYPASRLLTGQMTWALVPSVLVPVTFVFFSDISLGECWMLAIAGWLNSTWSIQQQILLGFKKFAALNLMTIAIPVFTLSGFALLHFFEFKSSLSYLSSIISAYFIAFLLGLYLLRRVISQQVSPRKMMGNREIFRKGFQNQLAHFASLFNSRLIFFVLPATSLGLWSNALSLGEAVFLIPGSLGQVAYGIMAGKTGKEDDNQVFQKAWLANVVVIIPCLLVAALLPDTFWQWIFGNDFSGISALLRLALPGIGMYSIYLLVSYRQSASGNFQYNFYALIAGLIINSLVTFMLLLNDKYSLNGGIIALVAGWGTASLASLFTLWRSDPGAFQSFMSLFNKGKKE